MTIKDGAIKTTQIYCAKHEDISLTLEYGEGKDKLRIIATWAKGKTDSLHKRWLVKNENGVWTLEVGDDSGGVGESINEEKVGTDEQEAKRRLINEVLRNFMDSGTVHFHKIEKALRKHLNFEGKLEDKELRCIGDGGKCEPQKKPPRFCNQYGCGG